MFINILLVLSTIQPTQPLYVVDYTVVNYHTEVYEEEYIDEFWVLRTRYHRSKNCWVSFYKIEYKMLPYPTINVVHRGFVQWKGIQGVFPGKFGKNQGFYVEIKPDNSHNGAVVFTKSLYTIDSTKDYEYSLRNRDLVVVRPIRESLLWCP